MKETIEWIPVSERLPQEAALILIDTGGAPCTGYLTKSEEGKRVFLSHFGDTKLRCIAWASLPKGYTATKEESE